MKKLTLLSICLFTTLLSYATHYTYTSIASGNFETNSTWSSSPSGGTYPHTGDTVIVNTNVTATAYVEVYNLTINSGYTLTVSGGYQLSIDGKLTNNGTLSTSGSVQFGGKGVVLSGTGSYTQTGSGNWQFYNSPQTIAAGVNLTLNSNNEIVIWVSGAHTYEGLPSNKGIILDNKGTVVAGDGIVESGGSSSCPSTWINDTNSSLSSGAMLNSYDTLKTSAPGNTFIYNSGTGTMTAPLNNKYYNLTISCTAGSYTASLPANTIVLNSLHIAVGILDVTTSNYSLTVGGNWTNSWLSTSFVPRSGTVTFNGSANQTIDGGAVTPFYNLTINSSDTVFTGEVETVSNNLSVSGGVMDCQTYQLTGNSSGTFSMSSGTGLVLGLKSSSTAVSFPYKFTSAHISLNAGSTVTYQANANQTISDTASYGNLVLNTGGSSSTKTPNGSITLAGNLTIGSGATLSMGSNNLTIAKNLTDNGTFSYGTGTVTFNGSANAQVNGSTTTNFYNLTLNTSATTDTVFLNNPITVNNTLTTTQGILDCQKHQLTNSVTPVVTLSPSSATICYGSSATLSASGYSNYIWYPSSSLSASTGSSVSASPWATTTYTIYGSSGSKYTCGAGTDVVTTNNCGAGDGASTAITITSSDTTKQFSMRGKRICGLSLWLIQPLILFNFSRLILWIQMWQVFRY